MTPVRHVHDYRDFIFAKINDAGLGFEEYFGPSLSSLDNMIDRSPEGKLEVAGGVLRYMHRCNWKMLVENLTDTCHPMIAHESSAGTAKRWGRSSRQARRRIRRSRSTRRSSRPTSSTRRWAFASGRTATATPACAGSIHSNYSAIPGYFEQMVAAYGEDACQSDPRREPPQHGLFSQHDDEGADPGAAHLQAGRGRSHDGGELDVPPRRRARPAPRAHDPLQPPDQRADARRSATTISKCTSARRNRCTPTAIPGSTCSASTIRTRRSSADRRPPTARPSGRCATSSAPGRTS